MLAIKMYSYSGVPNKLNKNDLLNNLKTVNGVLRDSTELSTPTVLIEGSYTDLSTYNYCIISELHRCYFVDSIDIITNSVVELRLKVDLLYTMASSLNTSCTAIVNKYSNADKNLNDYPQHYNMSPTITQIDFPNSPFIQEGNIIMITARG